MCVECTEEFVRCFCEQLDNSPGPGHQFLMLDFRFDVYLFSNSLLVVSRRGKQYVYQGRGLVIYVVVDEEKGKVGKRATETPSTRIVEFATDDGRVVCFHVYSWDFVIL